MVKTEGSLLTFHGTHKTAAFTMLGDAIKEHMEASVIAVKSPPPTEHDKSSITEPGGSSSSVKGKANKTREKEIDVRLWKENEWIEKYVICDDIIEVGDIGDQRNDKWLFECTVIISGEEKKVMTAIENSYRKDRPVFLVKGLGGYVDDLVSEITNKYDNNDGDIEGYLSRFFEGDNLSQTSDDSSLFGDIDYLYFDEDSELSDSYEDSFPQNIYENKDNNPLQMYEGHDDINPPCSFEGRSAQQISEYSNSLQISEDSNPKEISEDSKSLHISEESNSIQISEDKDKLDKIAEMMMLGMLHVYDLDVSTLKRLSSESELGLEDITAKKSMRWEILTAAIVHISKEDPLLERHRTPMLEMCIEFNAFDLAKEKKLLPEKPEDLEKETLAKAFQWRRVDFIKYFWEMELEKDKKIEEKKKGEERKIQEKKILGQDIEAWYKKACKKTDDEALKKALKDLIPSFIFTEKGTKKENLSRRNIFILTLLIEKPETLDMEWLFKLDQFRSKEAAALFACGLLKAIAIKKGEYWLHYETYIKKSGEFGKMAEKIISGYYDRSPSKTYLFLRQRLPAWGNMSLIQMAMETRNTSFLSLEPCQKIMEIVWIWGNAADAEIFKQKKDAPHKVYAGLNKEMLSSLLPPRVMYFFDLLGLILFLLAFALLIVSSLETGRFHFLEWILLTTVITFLMQEFKQLCQLYKKQSSLEQGKDASKTAKIFEILGRTFLTHFEDYFNIIDFSSVLIYFFAFTARVVAYYDPANTKYMDAARALFSVNFAVFTLRLLRFCYISKSLGPVVHMIGQMVKILVKFLVILTIFFFAYAVASEALLYPESKMSWALVFHVLRKPYWSMYGELFLDELEADESDTCTQCTTDPNMYEEYDQLRCVSQTGRYIVPIFLGIYVMIVNILLFNLLIAKFSSAVTNAENESKELWSYQRAMMLREFTETILPFPFTLLTFLLWLVRQPHNPFSTGPEPGKSSSKKTDPQMESSQPDSSQGSKPNQVQGTTRGQDDVQNQEVGEGAAFRSQRPPLTDDINMLCQKNTYF